MSKEIKDPNWIFLTGENGYGKTSFLQAIVIGLFGDKDGSTILKKDSAEIYLEFKNGGEYHINSIDRNHYNCKSIENFAAYGPARLNKSSDEMPQTYSLFKTDGKLLDIEGSLKLWYNKRDNHELYENISKILLELLNPYIDELSITEDNGLYTVVYHEKGTNDDDWKTFNELASGYRSIIAMFGDMILRLRKNQATVKNAKDLAGIVLIDEFDLHLHPKWQRDLVVKLSKTFPKIQFIVSTHSPIPLLGAPKNSVFIKVDRNKIDGITVEVLNIDISTLTPNSILTSPVFGFEDINSTEVDIEDIETADKYSNVQKDKSLRKKLNILKQTDEDFFNDLIAAKK